MDPLTMAQGIATSVGSLFKGIMGFNAGNAQAKALRFAAQQAEAEGGQAASTQVEEGNALAARAAVQGAANGGGFTGSTLGVLQGLANKAMFNARAVAYRGRVAAQKAMYDSQVAKADATNALIGGVTGSVSALGGAYAKSVSDAKMLDALRQKAGDGGLAGAVDDASYNEVL